MLPWGVVRTSPHKGLWDPESALGPEQQCLGRKTLGLFPRPSHLANAGEHTHTGRASRLLPPALQVSPDPMEEDCPQWWWGTELKAQACAWPTRTKDSMVTKTKKHLIIWGEREKGTLQTGWGVAERAALWGR